MKTFDIGNGRTQTQVGLIKFSSIVTRVFDLNTYSNKSQVISAIEGVVYGEGGTNTHLAIDEMTRRGFSAQNGARAISQGHPRVGILVTDGQSNDPPKTVNASLRAHEASITMFAVGVGEQNIDIKELRAVASDPKCFHLMILANFKEFDSLKYAIGKKTCKGRSRFWLIILVVMSEKGCEQALALLIA